MRSRASQDQDLQDHQLGQTGGILREGAAEVRSEGHRVHQIFGAIEGEDEEVKSRRRHGVVFGGQGSSCLHLTDRKITTDGAEFGNSQWGCKWCGMRWGGLKRTFGLGFTR